jgi:hypothetical protein
MATRGAVALSEGQGARETESVNTATFRRLRLFNGLMVPIHYAQGILMLLLSTDFALPVTTSFLRFDEASEMLVEDPNTIGDLRIAPLVAAFLFISGTAHLLLVLPGINGWYNRNLAKGINYARWIEYSISASIMIVVIAMLTGVYDLGSLIMLFALNATMISFGLVMEMQNKGLERDEVSWTPFWIGCAVGAVPWIIIGLYLFAPATRSIGDVPNFVYGIFGSLFVFFNIFAINMFLQYRKIGRWRDYFHGERAYIVLSLTAKSALAWQVFFGTLRDV